MKYKILSKKSLFRYKFLEIEEAEIEVDRYDGRKMEISRIGMLRSRIVALLLKNTNRNCFVFVEQFRYSAVESSPWVTEVVAGVTDPGEDSKTAIIRECLEETGYRLKSPRFVQSYMSSIGLSNQIIDFYYGEVKNDDKVETGGGLENETEDIRVVETDIREAQEQSTKGCFIDGKTLFAIQWYTLNHS